MMTRSKLILTGIGLGAGVMYFCDPDRGRRRRAIVRDRATRVRHDFDRELGKARRDIRHRASGLMTEARKGVGSAVAPNAGEDDAVLEPRVRSRIGRAVLHPHAVEVSARRGVITLKGDVLASEVDSLLQTVSSTPGVAGVKDELHVFESPEGVPSLQGRGKIRSNRGSWAPAYRLLAGLGGGALAVYGVFRGGLLGGAAGLTGAAALTRATLDKDLKRVAGLDGSPSVEIQKTVHIDAPVADVFRFVTDFTNLPRFMAHLREVRDLGGGKYRWVADGPAGVPVAWDAEVTKLETDKLVEWKTLPDSAIVSEGSMRFESGPGESSRIMIRMSYSPPAGMIGHTVASILGADPKHEMDEDFARLKSLLEGGKTRIHGKVVTLRRKPA